MAREDLRLPETVSENRYNQRTSSIHLGEILKFREDHHNPRNVSNRTLGSVLNLEIRSSPEIRSGRTLLDIIQADSTGESKKTWRYFREKLRLKRANDEWTSEMQRANSSNNNGNNRMMLAMRLPTSDPDIDSASSRTLSSLLLHKNLSSLLNEESTENNVVPEETDITPATTREEEEEEEGEAEGEWQVRMSLMALLAETDREMGIDSAYVMEEDEDVVVEEDENDGGGNVESGDYSNCCVCMVRHKGSAFIPCGHTFCRLCSRELYVQRGNCPICNAFILEILDIF